MPSRVPSQETLPDEAGKHEASSKKNGEESVKPDPGNGQAKKEKTSRNFNIDAKMLYGQYNSIFWTGSILQNFDKFTYQLNSNFTRSNDFGHKNSRYYNNEAGFTGDAEITNIWKFTPELSVGNVSYGLFRNLFYNREEKDEVFVKLKNEIKSMPNRWEINVGGVYFIHRLDSPLYQDAGLLRPYHSSDFYKANAEIVWEYIWSAANKLRFNSKFFNYTYSARSNDDTVTANELIWNFNISEYFKFGLGPQYIYNRDRGNFISGKIDVATVNVKYIAAGASYVYDMIPFTPEDYYFNQKYVLPCYSLYPGKGHHVNLNVGVEYTASGKDSFYVKKIKFKASGSYVTNDRFYSFFSLPELLLAPHRMKVMQCRARADGGIGFAIYSSYLEIGGKYEYTYSYASDYVTYQPEHQASGYIQFNVWRLEFYFNAGYRSRVHASPFINHTIAKSLVSSCTLQFRVLDSFYLYGKIDNIYNTTYRTVYGYPEPGVIVAGGLRIMI
jgi:hypothetical protein